MNLKRLEDSLEKKIILLKLHVSFSISLYTFLDVGF